MEIPKGTKIAYFEDSKNRNRILTLAYKLTDMENNTVAFGYSVNRPTEWKSSTYRHGKSFSQRIHREELVNVVETRKELEVGDIFSKKVGIEISLGRLEIRPRIIGFKNNKPKVAILESLATDSNGVIRRIAKRALERDRALLLNRVNTQPIPEYDYSNDWEY